MAEDGSIKIAGTHAIQILLRIVLQAKFSTEPDAEILLSPHVNHLVDELVRASPIPLMDWSNSAMITPPEFMAAVDVVRQFRDLHEPEADLIGLINEALRPYAVPAARLGI
jgi:hypothetical protein